LVMVATISIACVVTHDDGDGAGYCLGTMMVGVALIFAWYACIFQWNDDRYISPNNNRLHLYSDFSSMGSNNVREVSELEGFFHLCFQDCEVCKERQETELIQAYTAKKAQERKWPIFFRLR